MRKATKPRNDVPMSDGKVETIYERLPHRAWHRVNEFFHTVHRPLLNREVLGMFHWQVKHGPLNRSQLTIVSARLPIEA